MRMPKLAVIILLAVGVCAAQTAATNPPEPETIGMFFYLDSASQTLKRLPVEEYKRHRSSGFATISDSVKVSGPGSTFQVAADDKTTFVFKVFKDEDAGKARLFQFTVKNGEREYELGKWKRRDYTPNPGIAVNVAKFGQSSYKITTETPLAAGEYALTLGPQLFTFSVSAAGK